MGSKEKEKSLLEIAIELLDLKKKPQKIGNIVKEVMEIKGVKSSVAKELAPQFILDFMQSGYFVYCGDETWDLKDRQPTTVLDKEGGDYNDIYEDDEDVKRNELKDDMFDEDSNFNQDGDEDEEDDEDRADKERDEDIARAFDDYDERQGNDNEDKMDDIWDDDFDDVDEFEDDDDEFTDLDDEDDEDPDGKK